MKRRAYIKFVGHHTIQITTLYLQKTIHLHGDDYINLITLKKVPRKIIKSGKATYNPEMEKLKFYAMASIFADECGVLVYGEKRDGYCESMGQLYKEDREGLFEITLKE